MTYVDRQYETAVKHTLESGHIKSDRTGTGTRSTFGQCLRYGLWDNTLPLITTKYVPLHLVAKELLWFISGDTNIKALVDQDCHIWDEWADKDGNLGPVYGAQWRKWPGKVVGLTNVTPTLNDGNQMHMLGEPVYEYHDQLADAIKLLRTDPDSRRIIVSAWNVGQLSSMALMPCHAFFQFYSRLLRWDERLHLLAKAGVSSTGKGVVEIDELFVEYGIAERALSLHLHQRSCDAFLGVPFNIASYALLAHMVAQQTNHVAETLLWTGTDFHLYSNHFEQAKLMLSREPYPFPTVRINKAADIDSYKLEDIQLIGYQHHPAIKAPVAV